MEIASKSQLRLAFLRWAVVTIPFILLLGFTSSRIAPIGDNNGWYSALAKPAATPPAAVFPIAWTVLYVLMGLALAMILHARGSQLRGPAIAAFLVQLLVNLVWAPLFFGKHQVHAALIVIIVMFVAAAITTGLFARIRVGAAVLMLPYLAWICFAGYLTMQIAALNPNAEALVPASATTQIAL